MKTADLNKMYPSVGMSFHLLMNKLSAWWRYPFDSHSREWYNTVMSGLSYRGDR